MKLAIEVFNYFLFFPSQWIEYLVFQSQHDVWTLCLTTMTMFEEKWKAQFQVQLPLPSQVSFNILSIKKMSHSSRQLYDLAQSIYSRYVDWKCNTFNKLLFIYFFCRVSFNFLLEIWLVCLTKTVYSDALNYRQQMKSGQHRES